MGKIGESSGWGQSDILGNNGDKSPKNLKFQSGDRDSISGEFGHPNRNVIQVIFLFRTTTRPTTTTQSNFDLNSNSGKWLPDPDLEECGYDLSTGQIIGKSYF